jgi:deoxyhypusine synthase
MSRYPEIEIEKARLYPIAKRPSKVKLSLLGKPASARATFQDWWESLPRFLAADDLKAVAADVAAARSKGRAVIFMLGGHVIKVGLSPLLIDLMKQRCITCLSLNGSGVIHDVELARFGMTSEDVAASLSDGSFGMAQETGDFINRALRSGASQKLGLGEAVGREILKRRAKYANVSLLAQAYKLKIPATVHVSIGSDIIHQHPSADGAAMGDTSLRDFRILARHLKNLGGGGVVLNVGSAVVLPEVFVKALNLARNLGYACKDFTTANFDMIQHYRPRVNVVQRPTLEGGKGYQITGHHEILIPLLAMGIKLNMKK